MSFKKRSFGIFFPLITFVIFTVPFWVCAQSLPMTDADQQFNYAKKLYSSGQYENAIYELNRFIHFFPNDSRTGTAEFLIGNSYFKIGKYSQAIDKFESFLKKHPKHDLSVSAYWMISESFIQLHLPEQAITILNHLLETVKDAEVKDRIAYKLGWIYLENKDIASATAYFHSMSDKKQQEYETDWMVEEIKKISQKNPLIAGALSVIPGLGQLYCERYQDALVAFLINLGFIASAVEAFDKNHYALGGLISFVGFGFYAGNIYGAANGAHKYNQMKIKQEFDRFKKPSLPPLSLGLGNNGISLVLTYSF